MQRVSIGFSMSLDGFIAGPNDEVDRVFRWYSMGGNEVTVSSGDQDFKMSAEAAGTIEEAAQGIGALVTARRTFDIAHAWGGKHPMNVPIVVLTHRIPKEWAGKDSIFTFVTTGISDAIMTAKMIAMKKDVAVGAPQAAQQALQAGLVDQIAIDLVPVLLGRGIRLFDHLGPQAIELEAEHVSRATGVTHLLYRVVK